MKLSGMRKGLRPEGLLMLSQDGDAAFTESRIALLEQIDFTGTITEAAKSVGISYRTAWLTMDHLNRLSDAPLVTRETGGKNGGGTRLTETGLNLLRFYRTLQKEHEKYLAGLRRSVKDFDRFMLLTRKLSLKTSARNQLFGKVESIAQDDMTAKVVLRLPSKAKIHSQITAEGLQNLGLRKGMEAYALIKANWITLSKKAVRKGVEENRLEGRIQYLRQGRMHCEVGLILPGGQKLIAALSKARRTEIRLEEGENVLACFKSCDVLLGVLG